MAWWAPSSDLNALMLGVGTWALQGILNNKPSAPNASAPANQPTTSGTPDVEDRPKRNPDGSKIPNFAWDADGSKAPGRPGAAEGFKDPPTGPTWGHPDNTGKPGWVDEKGNVWSPTGQSGGKAHGGPHWDVQLPGGAYTNVYPGGSTR